MSLRGPNWLELLTGVYCSAGTSRTNLKGRQHATAVQCGEHLEYILQSENSRELTRNNLSHIIASIRPKQLSLWKLNNKHCRSFTCLEPLWGEEQMYSLSQPPCCHRDQRHKSEQILILIGTNSTKCHINFHIFLQKKLIRLVFVSVRLIRQWCD